MLLEVLLMALEARVVAPSDRRIIWVCTETGIYKQYSKLKAEDDFLIEKPVLGLVGPETVMHAYLGLRDKQYSKMKAEDDFLIEKPLGGISGEAILGILKYCSIAP